MSREAAMEVSPSGIVPKGSKQKHYRMVVAVLPAYQMQSLHGVLALREFHILIMIWKRV